MTLIIQISFQSFQNVAKRTQPMTKDTFYKIEDYFSQPLFPRL